MPRHAHNWIVHSYQLSPNKMDVTIVHGCTACGQTRTTKRPNKRFAQN